MVASALDWIELPRAREDTGRGATVLIGAGDARTGILGSGSEAKTGEDVAEVDAPVMAVLLHMASSVQ